MKSSKDGIKENAHIRWWHSMGVTTKRDVCFRNNVMGSGLQSFNPESLSDAQIKNLYEITFPNRQKSSFNI